MSAKSTYVLYDEPTPGPLEKMVVDPLWPFFAIMFAGPWLSWTWFILNAFAVGSPTRVRETIYAVAAALGCVGLVLFLTWFAQYSSTAHLMSYYAIFILVWKISFTYKLYMLQSRTFEIYTYFGGERKNGIFIIIIAIFLEGRLIAPLFVDLPYLRAAFL